MTATDGEREITRRKLLGGMAGSAAVGLAGSALTQAAAEPIDPQALERLVAAIEDVPTEKFEWGTLKWLLNAARSPGAEQTIGICQILPEKGNPLHYHPNCEEVLYMIAGRGRHSLGDQAVELTPGMAIRVPQNIHHNLLNTGWETIICLVSFSSGDRKSVFLK